MLQKRKISPNKAMPLPYYKAEQETKKVNKN